MFSIAGAFAMTSCNKMLDIEQHGVEAIDDFYKTDAQVESANAETYNLFRAQPNGASTLNLGFYGSWEWCQIAVKEQLSDNTWGGGENRNDNTDGFQVAEYSFDSENPALEKYYTLLYTLVYRANLVLDNAAEGQSTQKVRTYVIWPQYDEGNQSIEDGTLENLPEDVEPAEGSVATRLQPNTVAIDKTGCITAMTKDEQQ
ncbi:MAG: hypothetical protein IJ584_11310, partial [Bacteroidales bacterium]|nr:hypothetical protein [Bacteroidales bacterium]